MTDTPVSRLRRQHRQQVWRIDEDGFPEDADNECLGCFESWPCDVIVALDGLEERDDLSYEPEALREFRERGYVTKEVDALQARIDAATVLIRQAMEERHFSIQPNTGDSETRCGAPFGTSIDTCPNCAPYRAWLGDKEAE